MVHAVSLNVVAQIDSEGCTEKRHHIFLEGERVLFTAASVAPSSVQGCLVLILLFFGIYPEGS